MTYCLYCGLEAIPSEIYNYIQLYECEKHHRTGILKEADIQQESDDKKDWKAA